MNENNDIFEVKYPLKKNSYEKELENKSSEPVGQTDESTDPLPEIRIIPSSVPETEKKSHFGITVFFAVTALCILWACSYFLMGDSIQKKTDEFIAEPPSQSKSIPERSLYKSTYDNSGLLIFDENGDFFDRSYSELAIMSAENFPSYTSPDGSFSVSQSGSGKVYSSPYSLTADDPFSYFKGRFSSTQYAGSLYEYNFIGTDGKEVKTLCSLVPDCFASTSLVDDSYITQLSFSNGFTVELSQNNWRCSDESLYGEYYEENNGLIVRCHTVQDFSIQLFIVGNQVYIQEFIYTGNGKETKNI